MATQKLIVALFVMLVINVIGAKAQTTIKYYFEVTGVKSKKEI